MVTTEQIDDPLRDVEYVASLLHVDRQTVRRYFRDETIPGAVRIGGKWLIADSRLQESLNTNPVR
jgi:predicted site-specific integrase-resolvase